MQLPMGADFAEAVLGLAAELLTAEAEQPLWRQQVGTGCWALRCGCAPIPAPGCPAPVPLISVCSLHSCPLPMPPQQAETVESVDAVTAALAGLPLPADGEALHHTRMLRMLGSIADIRWARVPWLGMCWRRGGRVPHSASRLESHRGVPPPRRPTTAPPPPALPNPRSRSERRADEIAAHTSLDPSAAAAVVAFFQRGGRQAEPLAGLPGLGGGVLPSL